MPKRTNYPFLNLKEAVEKVDELRSRVGTGPYSQEAVFDALGYKGISGASTRALASLIHYNLLSRSGQSQYELSDIATRILKPLSDEMKRDAIKEAAISPKLFADLADKYHGETLPTMLENNLIHGFQMSDLAAKKAATVFRKAMKYAGLMSDDGRLLGWDGGTRQDVQSSQGDKVLEVQPDSPIMTTSFGSQNTSELNRVEIILREGVKAGIYVPYNLTPEEKAKLKTIIDIL